ERLAAWARRPQVQSGLRIRRVGKDGRAMTPDELRKFIAINLLTLQRPPTPMPECAEVLLSVIHDTTPYFRGFEDAPYWSDLAGSSSPTASTATPAQFVRAFKDYFAFDKHNVFPPWYWDFKTRPENRLDDPL